VIRRADLVRGSASFHGQRVHQDVRTVREPGTVRIAH
jgi:hypothetical protein